MSLPITRLAGIAALYRNSGPLPAKQRIASGVAGVSLLASGLKRGGFLGVLMAAAGADLVYRGIVGEGHIYELALGDKPKLLPEAVTPRAAA